jgi:hypothetical protein
VRVCGPIGPRHGLLLPGHERDVSVRPMDGRDVWTALPTVSRSCEKNATASESFVTVTCVVPSSPVVQAHAVTDGYIVGRSHSAVKSA